jgi:dihydrodipicolinate synthase/N-acetylneuraminate lyase
MDENAMAYSSIRDDALERLRRGVVIPAHPLALTERRKLDERRQRALTRYYLAAGAGGVAVGVHTTQFAIRKPNVGLLRPVLELAAEEVDRCNRPTVKVAGICGDTRQAVIEATMARDLGYDVGLLSLAAMQSKPVDELITHSRQVADIIPLMGFYLQPAVGGRVLPYEFWRRFAEIKNVLAIKIAPFNRYQTIDVVRGVAESGRADEITLYTGNDDNIIADLLTRYEFAVDGQKVKLRITGGLLGHWAVWTRRAVEQLEAIHQLTDNDDSIPAEWLQRNIEVTDANAAFFDAPNGFAGCIAGIHEVLRRQGLLVGRWCLDPNEKLSKGQTEQIERVYADYPHLNDDDFVAAHLHEWLA